MDAQETRPRPAPNPTTTLCCRLVLIFGTNRMLTFSRMRGASHAVCAHSILFLSEIDIFYPTFRFNFIFFHGYISMACLKTIKIDGNRRIDEKRGRSRHVQPIHCRSTVPLVIFYPEITQKPAKTNNSLGALYLQHWVHPPQEEG